MDSKEKVTQTIKGIKGKRGKEPHVTYHPIDEKGQPIITSNQDKPQAYDRLGKPINNLGEDPSQGKVTDIEG